MPYLVLMMEGLAVLWFVIMILYVSNLHKWSYTVTPARLDDVGRAIQTSAKWAFPVGMTLLAILTITEVVELNAL